MHDFKYENINIVSEDNVEIINNCHPRAHFIVF